MTLTRYGKKEWLRATITAAILLFICVIAWFMMPNFRSAVVIAAALILLIWLAFVAFFRDPNRTVPMDDPGLLLSPADGVIRDCELIPSGSCDNEALSKLFEGKDMLRIGIFLSVFNVHLNRFPCKFTVQFTLHKNGAYHDARNPQAIRENESQITGGIGEIGDLKFPVAVKQISGAIARRIVCPVTPGAVFARGERYGMIKFGSRTELYLPAKEFESILNIGTAVRGGLTPIARLKKNS